MARNATPNYTYAKTLRKQETKSPFAPGASRHLHEEADGECRAEPADNRDRFNLGNGAIWHRARNLNA